MHLLDTLVNWRGPNIHLYNRTLCMVQKEIISFLFRCSLITCAWRLKPLKPTKALAYYTLRYLS